MSKPTNVIDFPIRDSDLTNEIISEAVPRVFSLPEELDITDIIGGNISSRFIPTALVMLATIKSITDYKNQFDRRYSGDAMAFLSNDDIREHLSNLHGKTPRLLRAMEQVGWLEIDNSYRVQFCSKGYRIGLRLAKSAWKEMSWSDALNIHFTETHEKPLTSGRKTQLLKLWDRACGFFYSWKGVKDDVLREVCRVTAGILPGLSIHDSIGLAAEMQRCAGRILPSDGPPDACIKAWSKSIEAIKSKELFVVCHDERRPNFTNRIFTNWTSMKREFRPFFRLNGRQMISVDIRACQPAILASFYDETIREDRNEKAEYVRIFQHGDIYSFLADEFNQVFPDKAYDRSKAKNAAIRMMFAKTIQQDRNFYGVFRSLFPILVARMEMAKRRSHKDLSRLTQLKESKIMNSGVLNELIVQRGISCLSIHDSIGTFEEHVETAKESIIRWFSQEMGFQPQLKVERNGSEKNRVDSSEGFKLAA